jgi:hypothetical protein
MNDISLVFLDYKKFKQCLKDLERDTDITWWGGIVLLPILQGKNIF